MIVQRKLPHGSVSTQGIKDLSTRDVLIRLNDNIASLSAQLVELQKAYQVMDKDVKAALAKIAAHVAV